MANLYIKIPKVTFIMFAEPSKKVIIQPLNDSYREQIIEFMKKCKNEKNNLEIPIVKKKVL